MSFEKGPGVTQRISCVTCESRPGISCLLSSGGDFQAEDCKNTLFAVPHTHMSMHMQAHRP